MMRSYTAVKPASEEAAAEDRAVHDWRVYRLVRLGLDDDVAEAVADQVDWHEVARLVAAGCPAPLAVAILN